MIENKDYHLKALDFIVIDSSKAHEIFYGRDNTMGIDLHISIPFVRFFLWEADVTSFFAYTGSLAEKQIEPAARICEKLKDMTHIFIRPSASAHLRTQALVMEIPADLIDYFSQTVTHSVMVKKSRSMEQIKKVSNKGSRVV